MVTIKKKSFDRYINPLVIKFGIYGDNMKIRDNCPKYKWYFSMEDIEKDSKSNHSFLIMLINSIDHDGYLKFIDNVVNKNNTGYPIGMSMVFKDNMVFVDNDFAKDSESVYIINYLDFVRIVIAYMNYYHEYLCSLSYNDQPSWLPEFESKFKEFQRQFKDVLETSTSEGKS